MRAGRLQHRIQIEREHDAIDDAGQVRTTWLPILTTRAEVQRTSANEFLTAFGEMDSKAVVFVIRYPASVIAMNDRIVMDGESYNITGMAMIGRRRGLELRAVAA